jgi:hypothetical protein
VRRIVEDEGFTIHPKKTTVSRPGGSQRITGLVVNGAHPPRVPRELKRRLRAAIHNRALGRSSEGADSPETLVGWAAYLCMTDPKLGKHYLEALGQTSTKVPPYEGGIQGGS